MVRVAVPRETIPGETRVALVPESVSRLVRAGVEVVVERGAGEPASLLDAAYEKAGATLAASAAEAYRNAAGAPGSCARWRWWAQKWRL